MTLGDAISAFRKEHGMSMDGFSEVSGISKAYISMLEKNQTQRGTPPTPSIDIYRNAAKGMGISLEKLIRMVDDVISVSKNSDIDTIPPGFSPPPETYKVPRIGTIACGEPILAEENIEGYEDVPSNIHCDFTLRCKGDSMINARIFDGDIVYIRQQDEVESGEIAAVLIDGTEATLKRVRIFEDHIILEPENPMYKPLVFWGEEMNRVRIIGKATHFMSEVI